MEQAPKEGNIFKRDKDAPLAPITTKVATALGRGIATRFLGANNAEMGQQAVLRAAKWFKKLTGFGKYRIHSNTIANSKYVSDGAALANFGTMSQGVRIKHREFICDLVGTSDFLNRVFNVNPSDPTVFKWLSQISGRFAKYQMRGLVFQYIPSSSAIGNAANASLGTIIMASNYNVTSSPFDSKQDMEASEYSISDMPCNAFIHAVECDPQEQTVRNKYVTRQGNDPAFTEHVNFQVATVGMQSEYKIGELWVAYDVVLMDPLVNPMAGVTSTAYTFAFDVPNPNNDEYFTSSFLRSAVPDFKFVRDFSFGTVQNTRNIPTDCFTMNTPGYWLISVGVYVKGDSTIADFKLSAQNDLATGSPPHDLFPVIGGLTIGTKTVQMTYVEKFNGSDAFNNFDVLKTCYVKYNLRTKGEDDDTELEFIMIRVSKDVYNLMHQYGVMPDGANSHVNSRLKELEMQIAELRDRRLASPSRK